MVCANPTCITVTGLQKWTCGKVWYCSEDCQKKHWKLHKAICKGTPKVAAAPEPLRVGSVVQLRNLQQAPELNGKRGEVISQDDETGRWSVQLFSSGEAKKVTDFKLFVVPSDLPKDDPALELVEKQESEFKHWGIGILSNLRPILTEKRGPGNNRTFLEQFEH